MGKYAVKGVNALGPRTGEQDGHSIRAARSCQANAQAVDDLRRDLSDVRKHISIGRKFGLRGEERSSLSGKGLVKLEQRTVPGVRVGEQYGIWQTRAQPVRVRYRNHL